MMNEENTSSDELAHYGVMGMKWGVRKSATGKDIRAARNRLQVKANKYQVQQDKALATARGSAARDREVKTLRKMESDFKKDPDRVIATRMTRGEKAAALIVGGPLGLVPIAATSAASRRIEFKQETGKYNK